MKYVLSLSLWLACYAGALETPQGQQNPPPQTQEGANESGKSQNETPQAAQPGAATDSFADHIFSSGLTVFPKLVRSSDIKYEKDSSETKQNQSDSFGLGISLFMKPKKWFGARAVAGLDFQSTRRVSFFDNSGVLNYFESPAAAAYLQGGYQVWRIYGDIGFNYPLDFRTEWSTYKLEVTPGARINLGIEIMPGIQVEYFYSFSSYGIKEKVNIGPSRDIRIFHNSSGFAIKLSGAKN